jgi:2Fe-2S ferredoxin
MAEIIYEEDGKQPLHIQTESGKSVMHTLLENGVDVEHACGGFCACSTCHVYILDGAENLSEQQDEEFDRLDRAKGVSLKSRLSCQALVKGGTVRVKIP